MQATKLIRSVLTFILFLAERDAAKAAEKQKQYKKKQAARAAVLRNEMFRAQAKANQLASKAGTCNAASTLGCNHINEAERNARTLASQLKNIVSGLSVSRRTASAMTSPEHTALHY